MSDRKKAIETLKQLRLDYEEFYEEHNNEVTQAYDIAIASLETDEAYQLEYEQTTKNDLADDFIEYAKKTFGIEVTFKKSDNPDTFEKLFGTTKNDLGVDAVSRQAVLDLIADYDLSMGQVVKGIHALSSVTPIRPKGHWIPTYGNVKCSACGHTEEARGVGKATHYCSFCGADMREVVEE